MYTGDGWTARKDRMRSNAQATLRRLDGTLEPVHLTNVSEDGCRIESERRLEIGERLRISIPKVGELDAQIRWAINGSAGARFDRIKR